LAIRAKNDKTKENLELTGEEALAKPLRCQERQGRRGGKDQTPNNFAHLCSCGGFAFVLLPCAAGKNAGKAGFSAVWGADTVCSPD